MKQLLLALTLICISISSFSNIVYVNHAASGSNNGTTWADAYTDLQTAFTNSSVNDEIWVAQGVYYPTTDVSDNASPTNMRTRTFHTDHELKIYGGFNGTETNLLDRDWELYPTVLSGDVGVQGDSLDNTYNVVYFANHGLGLELNGFQIQDGQGSVIGGGGVYIQSCAGISLENIIFYNNQSQNGSSSIVIFSEVYFTNCEFKNNFCQNKSAGIMSDASSLDIRNCSFHHNYANYGTALDIENSPGSITHFNYMNISNCIFYKNTSENFGGSAVFSYNYTDTVRFNNCTFSQNTMLNGGNGTIRSNNVNMKLTNCILWENSTLAEATANNSFFTVKNSVLKDGVISGSTVTTAYPEFADSTNQDFSLAITSPAINIGDTTNISNFISSYDLAGNNRYYNQIDLGCYENCEAFIDLGTTVNNETIGTIQTGATFQWLDCDNSNSEIVGATNSTFTAVSNGNYACEITLGCSVDTTSCVTISSIGSSSSISVNPNLDLITYPNPITDVLFIQTKEIIKNIIVTDLKGRQLMQSTGETELNFSQFESGFYILHVETNNGIYNTKILKK